MEEVEKARALAKKAKEEEEAAKEEAEQHGYDVGVAETEESRMPFGPRSLVYVRLTVTLYGMKRSTKLRLSLLLCLGNQKVSITP